MATKGCSPDTSVNRGENHLVSAACHTRAMTWETFDARSASGAAQRGLKLIGIAVRRRRHYLGVSQRELGTYCGIDQTVIGRLENGKLGGLRWSRFASLVNALNGLDVRDGVRGADHAFATATMVERREGMRAASRSPTRPTPNVGK
jgi:hypothetical protein